MKSENTKPEVTSEDLTTLTDMVNKLSTKLEESIDLSEIREAENVELQEQILRLEKSITERETDGEYIERDVNILHDPYDEKNAYQILSEIPGDDESPEGWVLGWKNPEYREKRGMRGWIEMEHGDNYCGKDDTLLKNYLNDPPERMVGAESIDSYVRRGGMILCRIPKNLWLARQQKRTRDSQRKQTTAGSAREEILRDGVLITGAGLKDDYANRKKFGAPPPKVGETEGRTSHPVIAKPEKD